MPGHIPYDVFLDAYRDAFPEDFKTKTPRQAIDDLFADYPQIRDFMDPGTEDIVNQLSTVQPAPQEYQDWAARGKFNEPVAPPGPHHGREATWPETIGLMGLRVLPAIGGTIVGGPGGGVGGAMAGSALAAGYEKWQDIGTPETHTNLLVQSALGGIPAGKVLSKVPVAGKVIGALERSGLNATGETVDQGLKYLGQAELGAIEGLTQGALSTEAEYRLREGRPPTMGERVTGTVIGGAFGGAMGGGAEAVRHFRSVRAQQKVTPGQIPIIETVLQDFDARQQAGLLTEQERTNSLPFLTKLFGQIQDPALKQATAQRLERIFLDAHQTDLRAASADFVQRFAKAAPTMGLYERTQNALKFTDFLRASAAERATIEGTADLLAQMTPGEDPFPSGARALLGPAPPGAIDTGTPTRLGPIPPTAGDVTAGPGRGAAVAPPPAMDAPTHPARPPGAVVRPEPPSPLDWRESSLPPTYDEVRQQAREAAPGAGELQPGPRVPVPEPKQPVLPRLGRPPRGMAPPRLGEPLGEVPDALGTQRQGLENLPPVKSGDATPDHALMLRWIAEDLKLVPEGEQGGGGSPDLTNVRKEDEGQAWADHKASHSGFTNPGTPILFGLRALGAKGSRAEIRASIESYLSGSKSKKGAVNLAAARKLAEHLQRAHTSEGAFDEATGNVRELDWNRLSEPLPPAVHDITGKPVKNAYEPVTPLEHILSEQEWAEQPRGLADRYVPHLLAPEEIYPKFVSEQRSAPPEVREALSPANVSDDDLLGAYQQGLDYGGVESGAMGWMMEEIHARGLRNFRQPGLQTEGPGSPARRSLPREIAEQPGLFEEALPENATPELAPPDFSLTPEIAQGSTGVRPGLFKDEPPVFGERRAVVPDAERRVFTPEERDAYDRRMADEALKEQYPGAFREDPGPPKFPSVKSEKGAVGKVPRSLPGSTRPARSLANLTIQASAFDDLRAHAKAGAGREVAGVVLGHADGGVTKVIPMRNVSNDPKATFRLDNAELSRVVRDADAQGLEVLATYHTQPNGSTKPSIADREGVLGDIPALIVGMDGGDFMGAAIYRPNQRLTGTGQGWTEGKLGVMSKLQDPTTPPAFRDIQDVSRFAQAIPRIKSAAGDVPATQAWFERHRGQYEGESWFQEAEHLFNQGQHQQAHLQIEIVSRLGRRAAQAGAKKIPDPVTSKLAVEMVDGLVKGGGQDPLGALFAVADGRTVYVPNVGRIVVAPEIPPDLGGKNIWVGPGGLLRPGQRSGKLAMDLSDGTFSLALVKDAVQRINPQEILDPPTKTSATRIIRQAAEQALLTPAFRKAAKALQMTPEEYAAQLDFTVSTAGKVLNALSQWKRTHLNEIRRVEIAGAASDDAVLYGPGNRILGRLSDIDTNEVLRDVIAPGRAWDRVLLAQQLTRQPGSAFAVLNSARRGFLTAQLATAIRNVYGAGIRNPAEALAAIVQSAGYELAGEHGKASAAWLRGVERLQVPYRILSDGLVVNPFTRARQQELAAIFEPVLAQKDSVAGAFLKLADKYGDIAGKELVGSVMYGDPTPNLKSNYRFINWIASTKVQNWLQMWNRSQEFSVRAGIFTAEMRARMRAKGIDPASLPGLSSDRIAELVGGERHLQDMLFRSTHKALNTTFAGKAIRGGFGYDAEGKAIGAMNTKVVDTINKHPLIQAGYTFPGFNLIGGPRFIYDYSLAGLVDPLYAKVAKRGRYFLGTSGAAADVELPKLYDQMAGYDQELNSNLAGRMTLGQRLGVQRRLAQRYETQFTKASTDLAANPALPGLSTKVSTLNSQSAFAKAEANSLLTNLTKLDNDSAVIKEKIRDTQAVIDRFETTSKQAVMADAPEDLADLVGRAIGGGGALTALAWGLRSVDGADDQPWYKVPVAKLENAAKSIVNMDFRTFGGVFAQHMFVTDVMRSFYKDTDRAALHKIADEKGYVTPSDLWQHYEGKYTNPTLTQESLNAFLSIAQTAGTTLALANLVQDLPQTGFSGARLGEGIIQTLGAYLASFTLPGVQVKNLAGQVDPEEAKARIARSGDDWKTFFLPLAQPLGNLPVAGRLIPETPSQITGEPLTTFWPGVRALLGLTLSEQTETQQILTEAGVPPASMYIRSSGDDEVDRTVGKAFAEILTTRLPAATAGPAFQKANTPALRRDMLQKFLTRAKLAAWARAKMELDPKQFHEARQTAEGQRRKLRWERLHQMELATEFELHHLRDQEEERQNEPPPEPPSDEPPQYQPLSDEPPTLQGAGSAPPSF